MIVNQKQICKGIDGGKVIANNESDLSVCRGSNHLLLTLMNRVRRQLCQYKQRAHLYFAESRITGYDSISIDK